MTAMGAYADSLAVALSHRGRALGLQGPRAYTHSSADHRAQRPAVHSNVMYKYPGPLGKFRVPDPSAVVPAKDSEINGKIGRLGLLMSEGRCCGALGAGFTIALGRPTRERHNTNSLAGSQKEVRFEDFAW